MINFDTFSLTCFVAVAETGSFTNAAQKVGRTQSALSQQIAKLETQIGKSLFRRDKKISLTPDGEIFLSYAQQILKLHREAYDRIRQPDLEGEIRFGLPEDFASVYLSEVLSEFTARHPRVLLRVECDLTLTLFDRFKHNEFDMVLVKMSKPQDFPNGIEVWSETLEWVGTDLMDFSSSQPIPLVLSPSPCVYRDRALRALDESHQAWRIVFSSHSYAGTIAAVRAGMGMTVLPRIMIPSDLSIIPRSKGLPDLDDTHISLLKHIDTNIAINSFERHVVDRLKTP